MLGTDFKRTEIGEIPDDWGVARLGDENIARIVMGQSPPSSTYNEMGEGLPFLQGNAEFGKTYPTPRVHTRTPLKIAEKGDILISVRAPVGELNLSPDRCCIGRGLSAIRPNPSRLDHLFMFYYLRHATKRLLALATGSTFTAVRKEDLASFLVALPPLPEQSKIASVLSTIDDAIQKTDEIIAKTQQLKKGLMQQLLTRGIGHTKFKQTEIGEIPDEWEVSTIGEECEVGTGGTPRRNNPEYFNGNIPWVKTTELNYNTITSAEERITDRALRESNARVYPKGTLLVAMYGLEAPGTRGKCAILGIDAAVNQACAAIQPFGRIKTSFLFYYYQLLRNRIMSFSGGTKRQNLSLGIVRTIPIPVPPMDEQIRVAETLSQMDEKVRIETKKGAQLGRIKKGLMQVLLTGKVRVKVD
jgi:type I restriction enzyme S subunit